MESRLQPFSPRSRVRKSCKISGQGRKNALGAAKGQQLPEMINRWRFLQQIRAFKAIQNYYVMHLKGAKNCDKINLGCAKAILCSLASEVPRLQSRAFFSKILGAQNLENLGQGRQALPMGAIKGGQGREMANGQRNYSHK